jgi:hypothetical protein
LSDARKIINKARAPTRIQRTKPEQTAPIPIVDAISDPDIFGPWFKDRKSWAAWLCFLNVIFGRSTSPSSRFSVAARGGILRPFWAISSPR